VHQSVILVADDEALVRNLVTLLLQQDGHLVLSAANGREGLELSRQYPGSIELVITDAHMPRMNGADLCAHLLQERPGIKVLVMSSADMGEIVSQNINLRFLPKPLDGKTLMARVRAILAAPVQEPVDLRRIISELRSERQEIERAVLSLERFDPPDTGTTEAAAQSATAITEVKRSDGDGGPMGTTRAPGAVIIPAGSREKIRRFMQNVSHPLKAEKNLPIKGPRIDCRTLGRHLRSLPKTCLHKPPNFFTASSVTVFR
jgi:CheY-like chemotaxis protein